MRECGVLMPVFSLPGPYGIGCFGKEAYNFVDFLAEAGQQVWQILPLAPTGYGDSPYQSCSAFASNPYFIDLDDLAERGLLEKGEYEHLPWGGGARIDYGALYQLRFGVLRGAAARFFAFPEDDYYAFCFLNEDWLEDYALYMAAKGENGMKRWQEWPAPLRRREPAALEALRKEKAEEISFWKFLQYQGHRQWTALKAYANEKGVRILGDMPIYVSADSADAWAGGEMFETDAEGNFSRVAGCPPDYFSADGQLWGNPLYRWDRMQADGFGWWIRRIDGAGKLYDVIRIDHFRGFESYWAVPYGEATAKNGRWVKGPGMALVGVLTGWFPQLEFIAEDLGYPTPEVAQLLRDSGLPGMKVLEFAFDSRDTSSYLPHSYGENCICYTGTHDNSPLALWRQEADPADIAFAKEYLGLNDEEGFNRGIIRGGMSSVAKLFVAQMQDYLELGAGHRTNEPGTQSGNWQWRMLPGELTPELAQRIRKLTRIYGRLA